MRTLIPIIIIAIISVISVNNVYAVSPNSAFILEGSGFAVTEEVIKISELDFAVSTKQQSGSSLNAIVEDGFITLNDEDFVATDLSTTLLREGKFIRINGIAENFFGEEVSLRFFGRLVEESKEASIYYFTGRIAQPDQEYKIIYTAKLSKILKLKPEPTITPEKKELTIHILKGASSKDVIGSYIQRSGEISRLQYFSQDRFAIEPTNSIVIVNDDNVSHTIISGKENYGDRHNPFTPDGRINTGEILPGESVRITFSDAGFYRLYDPTYTWMDMIGYVFPKVDNIILGEGKNLGN